MDASAFDADVDDDLALSALYQNLPEDAKGAIRIVAFAASGVGKLCLIVLAVAGCAAAFTLLIGWIGIFWMQTHLLLKLSTVLRVIYDVPHEPPVGGRNGDNERSPEKHGEALEAAKLITNHIEANHVLGSHQNDASLTSHSAAEMDMFEDFLNSPKDARETRSSLAPTATAPAEIECEADGQFHSSFQTEDVQDLLDEQPSRAEEELQVPVAQYEPPQLQLHAVAHDLFQYSDEGIEQDSAVTSLKATDDTEEDQLKRKTLRGTNQAGDNANENRAAQPRANLSSAVSKKIAEQTAWLAKLQSGQAGSSYPRASQTSSGGFRAPQHARLLSATTNTESRKRASALGFSAEQLAEAANFAGGASRGGSKRSKPPARPMGADHRNTQLHSLYNSHTLGTVVSSQQDLPLRQQSGQLRHVVPATTNATNAHSLRDPDESTKSSGGELPPHLRKRLAAQASRSTAEEKVTRVEPPINRFSAAIASSWPQADGEKTKHVKGNSTLFSEPWQVATNGAAHGSIPVGQNGITSQIQMLKSFNTGRSQEIDPRFVKAQDMISGFATKPMRTGLRALAIPPIGAGSAGRSKSVDKTTHDAGELPTGGIKQDRQGSSDFHLSGGNVVETQLSTVDSKTSSGFEIRANDANGATPCDNDTPAHADARSDPIPVETAASPVTVVRATPIDEATNPGPIAASDISDTATQSDAHVRTEKQQISSPSSAHPVAVPDQAKGPDDGPAGDECSERYAASGRKAALQQAVEVLNQQAHQKRASLSTLKSFPDPSSLSPNTSIPDTTTCNLPVASHQVSQHPDLQELHVVASTAVVTASATPTPEKRASSLRAKAPAFFAPSPKIADTAANGVADKNSQQPNVSIGLSHQFPLYGSLAYSSSSSHPTPGMGFHQFPDAVQNINDQSWPQSHFAGQYYGEDSEFGYPWDAGYAGTNSKLHTPFGIVPGSRTSPPANTNTPATITQPADTSQDAQPRSYSSPHVFLPNELRGHAILAPVPIATYEQTFPALPPTNKVATGISMRKLPGLENTNWSALESFHHLLPGSNASIVELPAKKVGYSIDAEKPLSLRTATKLAFPTAGHLVTTPKDSPKPLEEILPPMNLSDSIDQRFHFKPSFTTADIFGTKGTVEHVSTKNQMFFEGRQNIPAKLDIVDKATGSDLSVDEINGENDEDVALEQDVQSQLELTADVASNSSLKKKRRAARAALIGAWVKREEARGRQVGLWTIDGARALEDATKAYNGKRVELAKTMAGGELSEEDAKTFAAFSTTDLSRPKRPQILQDALKKNELADDKVFTKPKSTVNAPVDAAKAPIDLKELEKAALEARASYQEAYAYFERAPPQGRSRLRELKLKGEKRIELAAKRYQKKIDELEAAYPQGLPSWLARELWTYNDEAEKKQREAWGF